MKYHLIILFLHIVSITFSQKEGNTWIVGYGDFPFRFPKNGKTELSFNSGKLEISLNTKEKDAKVSFINASICDENGDILLFSEGLNIYGNDQKIILNGENINPGEVFNDYSPQYYPCATNHVFLPDPNNNNEYYLIHLSLIYNRNVDDSIRGVIANKLLFTKIIKNNGVLSVSTKNNLIAFGEFVNHHMAYCRHGNGSDWWIIIEEYGSNRHYFYLLDKNGIHLNHIQDIGLTGNLYDWSGNSIISPDGTLFAKYTYDNSIQIFDFDRCSGLLSNETHIDLKEILKTKISSIAFSPNSQFLYLANFNRVWQFDMLSQSTLRDIDTVGIWDEGTYNSFNMASYQLSLANDGIIYLSCWSSNIYLHAITDPNQKKQSCNFNLRYLELPALMNGGLPILPNFALGPAPGSLCDTLMTNVIDYIDNTIIYFKISPNPCTDKLYIDLELKSAKAANFSIFNSRGDLMITKLFLKDQNQYSLNISYYPRGMYFYNLKTDQGNSISGKLIFIEN